VCFLFSSDFIGAIHSIPLTMTLKFAFESNERTRWIAMLLSSEKWMGFMRLGLVRKKIMKKKLLER